MKTLYLKRKQVLNSVPWGIQVSSVQTDLIRAYTSGSIFSDKRPLKVTLEWVCNGKRIEGEELERLLKRFPVCEFQQDEDLTYRALRDIKAKRHSRGAAA
ncbi:hypothetical protein [Comamonas thiooxydans]|uniref:hypothetical protein n=1 Tax=Comamonas thiooxydans TaxID=363952 RepID=UPI0011865B78|nr:hypothetical protein [Comamonas thiooxydans]